MVLDMGHRVGPPVTGGSTSQRAVHMAGAGGVVVAETGWEVPREPSQLASSDFRTQS